MPEQDTGAQLQPTGVAIPAVGGAPFYVGMRYLLKKKLSYLAMIGVAICVGVLIVVMSVMTGFSNQLRSVIRGYLSDINIQPNTGKLYGFTNWRDVMDDVLKVDHVAAAAPYIEGVGLLRAGTKENLHVIRIAFRGIDPELEKHVSSFGQDVSKEGFILKGRLEDLNKPYTVENAAQIGTCMIGSVMSGVDEGYPFTPGIQIGIFTATGDLRWRFKPYALVGVFKTGRQDYDNGVVILSLESAMDLVASEGVSGLSVRLDDYVNAPQVVAALQQKLGGGYMVRTWEEQEPTLVTAVKMERFLMALILCFISVQAGFCIFAILTMTVHEKRRDIGILKAIGFTEARIAAVFVLDGAAIGVLGALLGVAGGLAFAFNINEIAHFVNALTGWEPWPPNIYYFTEIPADRSLLAPAIIAATAILSSLLFSVLPALKAARLDPVEALRFE
jgi:lipoprotein-releasing system permease protein